MTRSSKQIEAQIIQDINNNIYPQDTYLPAERTLAEQNGVSRSIIREAIFGLQARGYVLLKPKHRPKVTKPSLSHVLSGLNNLILSSPEALPQETAKNIGQIRCMLEQESAIELSLYGEDEHFKQLSNALENNKKARNDFGQFQQTDIAFHHTLFCACQNSLLIKAHTLISDWLMHYFETENVKNKSIDNIIAQHEAIVDAIHNKQLEDIITNIRKHLQFYQHQA